MIWSDAFGGSISGGDHDPVSRTPGSMPSGRLPGVQCADPATRYTSAAFSGLAMAKTLPFANSSLSAGTLSVWLAIRASLARTFLAAISAATAVDEENREE